VKVSTAASVRQACIPAGAPPLLRAFAPPATSLWHRYRKDVSPMAQPNRDFPFAYRLPTDLAAQIALSAVPRRELPHRTWPARAARRWPWHAAGRYAA
jgi:hypothetical protein